MAKRKRRTVVSAFLGRLIAACAVVVLVAVVAYFTRPYWSGITKAAANAIDDVQKKGAQPAPAADMRPKTPLPPPPPIEVPREHQAEVAAAFSKGASKLRSGPFVTANPESCARYRKWMFTNYTKVRPLFRATRRGGQISERAELDFNAAGKQSPPKLTKSDAAAFDVIHSGNGFQVKYHLTLVYQGRWEVEKAQWNYVTVNRFLDIAPDEAHHDFLAWLLEELPPVQAVDSAATADPTDVDSDDMQDLSDFEGDSAPPAEGQSRTMGSDP